MPELPEVETIRRQLHEQLAGASISLVTIFRSGRERPVGKKFVEILEGKKIRSVERRAKLLIWRLEGEMSLLAHLKMTGAFVFVDEGYLPSKHDRILFELASPKKKLRLIWSDVRQFGFTHLLPNDKIALILDGYGPEPLEASVEHVSARLDSSSKRTIKSFLLDQAVVAGVGNIYADESLHRAGIRPTRRVDSLSSKERLVLAKNIKEVLSEAVDQNGTSAHDYVDTQGDKGGFLEFLRVYGRPGEPCRVCKTPIKKIVVGQRGTHYCPKCQR